MSYNKKTITPEEAHRGDFIRKEIFKLIQNDYPDFTLHSYISIEELNCYRKKYLASLIKQEVSELNELEKEVVNAIFKNNILSKNIEVDFEKKLTFGQKLS